MGLLYQPLLYFHGLFCISDCKGLRPVSFNFCHVAFSLIVTSECLNQYMDKICICNNFITAQTKLGSFFCIVGISTFEMFLLFLNLKEKGLRRERHYPKSKGLAETLLTT